jgi:hypothetical protein
MGQKDYIMPKTCKKCKSFGDTGAVTGAGECRLNPPTALSLYMSCYPTVRADCPACSQYKAVTAAKKKPASKRPAMRATK